MKLSTRPRYALRLLLDLALHHTEQPVPVRDISRRQEISLYYLQHLITPLATGGIIMTSRGTGGGISLTRDPAEIRVLDVFQLIEGPVEPVACVTHPETCSRSEFCCTRRIWCRVKQAIEGVLEKTTLADLAIQQQTNDRKAARRRQRVPGN